MFSIVLFRNFYCSGMLQGWEINTFQKTQKTILGFFLSEKSFFKDIPLKKNKVGYPSVSLGCYCGGHSLVYPTMSAIATMSQTLFEHRASLIVNAV